MQEIVLLGTGNVATHLFKAIQNSDNHKIIQVYNRSSPNLKAFKEQVDTTSSLDELKPADIYLVSISDDSVKNIIQKISTSKALIAHTTGSVPLLDSAKRNGVFYPLQTFSKHTPVDFSKVPLCLEASSEEDFALLKKLAEDISQHIYSVTTEQRKALHLAAVFACNFTNHLYRIAEKICQENQLSFEIMHPLIEKTAEKIKWDSPKNLQTGPAIREDQKTIDFHLDQLDSPDLKEIYTLLTQSIQAKNGSKL